MCVEYICINEYAFFSSLLTAFPGDDDAGFAAAAKAKAKAKAKGGPKKANKKPKALGDEEHENSEPSRKKTKVDKEAKQRLDALKLQTDMVHMSQKWTSRIKTLNIEVTASVQACQDFSHLVPFLGENKTLYF